MIWFDVLIFAAVAAFLAYRLNQVLGQRHGDERQQENPFEIKPEAKPQIRTLEDDSPLIDAPAPIAPKPKNAPDSLAGRIEMIELASPAFNEKSFLSGARGAFEMIVGAFAAEDTTILRPLLSDDVYDGFSSAIRTRQAAKEKLSTRILRIKEVEITEASLVINTAKVTVRFVSEQIQFVRNAAGEIISGSESASHEVVDIWTFTRNLRATDPNWHLCETRTGN